MHIVEREYLASNVLRTKNNPHDFDYAVYDAKQPSHLPHHSIPPKSTTTIQRIKLNVLDILNHGANLKNFYFVLFFFFMMLIYP